MTDPKRSQAPSPAPKTIEIGVVAPVPTSTDVRDRDSGGVRHDSTRLGDWEKNGRCIDF